MNSILALDVGERRIGVAWANDVLKIPFPLITLTVDDDIVGKIEKLAGSQQATLIVIGLPRNQSGEETAQSQLAREFAEKLQKHGLDTVLQDESLTSVLAEEELQKRNKPYKKEDIDSLAATFILQDYLQKGGK